MFTRRRGSVVARSVAVVALVVVTASCGDDPADEAGASDSSGTESDAASAELSGDPVRLGVLVDSSGAFSSVSDVVLEGIEAAVDDVNEAGGVLGRPLETVVASEDNDPTKAPAATRSLIDDGADSIVLAVASPSVMQAKAVIQEEGVPSIAAVNLLLAISDPPDNDFVYQLPNPNEDIGSVLAAALEGGGDIEEVAAVLDDSPAVAGSFGAIRTILEDEAGLEFVEVQTLSATASDVTAQISRVADSDPDAVIISTQPPQVSALIHNALAQSLPDVPRFDVGSLGSQAAAWDLMNGGALEGVVYPNAVAPDSARTREVADSLGVDPQELQAYTVQGYDAVALLAQAIETAGVTDRAAVNDQMLATVGYEPHYGADGFTLSFGADKHLGPDNICGLVLREFDGENRPGGLWPEYEPDC